VVLFTLLICDSEESMETVRVLKFCLDIIGFPFSMANLYLNTKRKIKAPGKLVKMNGRHLHTVVSGDEEAQYTVILDAGLSCCSLDWFYIQPEVSKFARVVSFDRAGLGWSTSSEGSNTCMEVVQDLKFVLDKLDIHPPYILVGHSFGGLNMRLFASEFPESVVGLLLIDPVHENRYLVNGMDNNRKKVHKKNLNIFRIGYITSGIGLPRLMKQPVGRKKLPEPFQKYINYIGYNPKAFEAVYKEFLYSGDSAMQVANSKPLSKDLPITILSSNNSDPTWMKHQKLLSNLTNKTKQIKTKHNHSIHLENPELVIDEILKLLETLEKGQERNLKENEANLLSL
jgi:pimeloyl-ACP methyl ester carboxylesterase